MRVDSRLALSVPVLAERGNEVGAGDPCHGQPQSKPHRDRAGCHPRIPGRVLFRDLSFDIERGAIVGIVGPNGSGKTTLLRTILGLLPPLRGQLRRDPNLLSATCPSASGSTPSFR